jgi:hypothetical protein
MERVLENILYSHGPDPERLMSGPAASGPWFLANYLFALVDPTSTR